VHADAVVYAGVFDAGDSAQVTVKHAWVHVARGKVRVNGKDLEDGDGASIEGEAVKIDGTSGGEVLVFDLP
jgi:redox-sensitive bicupin YhaK (pirin superfamily)